MTSFTRRSLLKGATAAGAVLAVGQSRSLLAADGATLRSRMNADIAKLDPGDWSSHGERDVIDTIYAKLVSHKPGNSWEWQLEAAESIEQVDPTHVRFTLRPNIMWTNGFGETTTEDVKYSFERIANPDNKFSYRDDWAVLDRVDIVDKYNGVIVLKEPFAPLWGSTLPWTSGSIVCKKAVEAMGGRFTLDPGATSGPYAIKEWRPKQKLVLERNPGWPVYPLAFEQIVLLPIEDENAAQLAYEAGELDYTKVSPTSIQSYKENLPPNSQLIERPTLDYIWLGMNVEHPKFSDPKVRQAVQKAVDVNAVLQGAYFGAAGYATGVVGPGLLGHLDTPLPTRDVEGARQLLAESDHPNGFKTSLYTLPRTDRVVASQIIQANLAEVGIEVEIKQVDTGQFWSLMDDVGKDIEMFINGYGGAPDPSWGTMWFTPEQVGIWNWERWNSPEFAEFHKTALAETDPAKRTEMYRRMGELMNESYAYVWLANEPWVAVYRDTITPASLPNGWVRYALFKSA